MLNTLIYNKLFKDKNFGAVQIPNVFTLGMATEEEAIVVSKTLEELRNKEIQNNKIIEH